MYFFAQHLSSLYPKSVWALSLCGESVDIYDDINRNVEAFFLFKVKLSKT